MNAWSGKRALITGGASGIGRALALELARRGASVIATDINDPDSPIGANVSFERLDVRDGEAFRSLVASIEERHGPIDLLVNNAGTGGASGEAQFLTPEHWKIVLDVNLQGVINGVQAVYPRMVERKRGRIVNVASLAGLGAAPFVLPYATSKAAVVGLSRTLRVEGMIHGVDVNVVCPAAIETPLLDSKHPADLPSLGWRPNIRRFLTSLAGPPYPVERFAEEAMDAIERNEAIIVVPGRARFLWRLGRFLPDLSERALMRKAHAERMNPDVQT